MQTEEIHALVRRAQAGDKAAKELLFVAFRPLIYKAAGQAHLAPVREDAKQEAALAFLCAVEHFDEGRGVPFAGFAKALVFGRMRTFFQHERRKWRREILMRGNTDEESGETEDFFESVEDERNEIGAFEEREAFRASLSSLPSRERKILMLYYEKGLPLRAIGAEIGLSEKHVSVVKARAMKKLREAIGAASPRKRRKKEKPSVKGGGKGVDLYMLQR